MGADGVSPVVDAEHIDVRVRAVGPHPRRVVVGP